MRPVARPARRRGLADRRGLPGRVSWTHTDTSHDALVEGRNKGGEGGGQTRLRWGRGCVDQRTATQLVFFARLRGAFRFCLQVLTHKARCLAEAYRWSESEGTFLTLPRIRLLGEPAALWHSRLVLHLEFRDTTRAYVRRCRKRDRSRERDRGAVEPWRGPIASRLRRFLRAAAAAAPRLCEPRLGHMSGPPASPRRELVAFLPFTLSLSACPHSTRALLAHCHHAHFHHRPRCGSTRFERSRSVLASPGSAPCRPRQPRTARARAIAPRSPFTQSRLTLLPRLQPTTMRPRAQRRSSTSSRSRRRCTPVAPRLRSTAHCASVPYVACSLVALRSRSGRLS